ncbi:MAG: PEGA domain-containing protein [Myxococcota bacterium]
MKNKIYFLVFLVQSLVFSSLWASPKAEKSESSKSDSPKEKIKEKKAPKPETLIFSFFNDKTTSDTLKFREKLVSALMEKENINWKTISLSLPSPDIEAIAEAVKLYKQGGAAGMENKLDVGLEKISQAIEKFEDNPYSLATDTGKALKQYRIALKYGVLFSFFSSKPDISRKYLKSYANLKPDSPANKWPSEMKKIYEAIYKPIQESGEGKITIVSQPPGAEIYLNYKKAGTTPLTIGKQKLGTKILCAVKPGYKPLVKKENYNPTKTKKKKIKLSLEPAGDNQLKHLLPAEMELGQKEAGSSIMAVAKDSKVQMLLFLYFDTKNSQKTSVTGFIFDKRLKTRLKKYTLDFNPASPDSQKINKFVTELYKDVPLDGKIPKKIEGPGLFSKAWDGITSISEKKYFWHTMGGIGGAIVIGAVTTIILTTQSSYRPRGGQHILFK